MAHKNITPLKDQKLYLVTFEFLTGEKRTIFKKGFLVKSEEYLKKDIDRYLMDYYGLKASLENEKKFFYHRDDDFSVNLVHWEEITSYEQFLNGSFGGV